MSDSDPLENLLPSLIQCFGVIFVGYLSVRLNIITSQTDAIGAYVAKFAMPALFFRSMATINFTDVNWLFILAIAISKLILFTFTCLCAIIITRPINFGKAGIFSMFITQSNDVALGYPILLSLYPDLAKYIYLFAPAQLILINPLCFVLLECHEYRSTRETSGTIYIPPKRRFLLVIKNVILNPIIFMTVFGVIFNFLLHHRLPAIMDKFLQILADSFAGVALFYLGMNMVGKISAINKKEVYLLVFLLLGKLILLPFLCREMVVHILNINSPSNQSLNYSLVAFLYGGLPTAPPVFLIANIYQITPDLIATGLVIGTFISGPLMFVTARLITMVVASKSQFSGILKSTAVSTSILSLVSCTWVILLFLLRRRCKSPIYKITTFYAFYVILTCSGAIVGRIFLPYSSNQTNPSPDFPHYFPFSLFFIGCVGTRLCTVLMAASLLIIKRRGISYLTMHLYIFYIVGFLFPVMVTLMLVIFSKKQIIVDIDPSFQYGNSQLITSLIILGSSIMSTTILLILEARSKPVKIILTNGRAKTLTDSKKSSICSDQDPIISSNENRTLLRISSNPSTSAAYEDETESEGFVYSDRYINDKELQIQRHLILILLIVVTMAFGWFLCLWRLIKEELSGVYIELEFLDCVFNFGQGFILWMIFGLDTELIVIPFKRRFSAIFCNNHEFYIPPESNLSTDVIKIRNQFLTCHLENCRNDIVKDIRYLFKLYYNVFAGKEFIDWILKVGLSNSREDAIGYGQVLLISRVIEHVKKNRNLKDDYESLYRFTESVDNNLYNGRIQNTETVVIHSQKE